MPPGLAVVCLFTQAVVAFAGSKTNMHWLAESGAAWDEAKASARPVLVEVWADWCQPCRRMDREVWSQARVIEAANKFGLHILPNSKASDAHISKLERSMMPRPRCRIAIRFEGSKTLSTPEPDIDEHAKVITIRFIAAKDGRPANPEDYD